MGAWKDFACSNTHCDCEVFDDSVVPIFPTTVPLAHVPGHPFTPFTSVTGSRTLGLALALLGLPLPPPLFPPFGNYLRQLRQLRADTDHSILCTGSNFVRPGLLKTSQKRMKRKMK